MARGLGRNVCVIAALASVALSATTHLAWAEPNAQLTSAADGTLLIVGDGWRPGQQLALSLGRDRFVAYVDSAGGFEVSTGLGSAQRDAIGVHHVSGARQMLDEPHPFALLYAQALVSGIAVLGASVGAIGLGYAARRLSRYRR